jgi:V8-like Glu-specific endopeptidase
MKKSLRIKFYSFAALLFLIVGTAFSDESSYQVELTGTTNHRDTYRPAGDQSAEESGQVASPWPGGFDPSLFAPMPFPRDTGKRTNKHGEALEMVLYDVATGEETIIPYNALSQALLGVLEAHTENAPEDPYSLPFLPKLPPCEEESARSFSPLQMVSDPVFYPAQCSSKLFFSIGGSGYVCSASLINARLAITAGHCVHAGSGGNWATDVRLVPAYHDGIEPFGYARATGLLSFTAWTQDGDINYDLGMIALDRPIGAITGWYGYGYNTDCNFMTGTNFDNYSYPAEQAYGFNGQNMFFWNGTFDTCSSNMRATIYNAAYGGMSGSSAYNSGGYIVYGIASTSDRATVTDYARMEESTFNSFDNFVDEQTPDALDLVVLDTHAAPQFITAGSPLTLLDYLVYNNSSATQDGVVTDVEIYLSTNNIISPGDTLLQTHSIVINASPNSRNRVNVVNLPIIPLNTTPGSYYIGAILKLNNNVSSTQDVAPITVTSGGGSDDTYEENDTCSQATFISSDGTVSNLVCNDSDWFEPLAIANGATLTTTINFIHANADVDMVLYDSDCSTILGSSAGTTDSEIINWTNTTGSARIVRAHVYLWSGITNNYSLTFSRTGGGGNDDIYEENDSWQDAPDIATNTTISGLICRDEDWFRIPIGVTTNLKITVSFNHSQGDLNAQLYDTRGATVGAEWGKQVGESYSVANTESIAYVNVTGCTALYLRVYGEAGAMNNNYSIYVTTYNADDSMEGTNDASCGTLSLLQPNQTYNDLICRDDDWYRVNVAGKTTLTVQLEHAYFSGDLDMAITRDTGDCSAWMQTLVLGNRHHPLEPETLTVNVSGLNNVLIRVYGEQRQANFYSLILTSN